MPLEPVELTQEEVGVLKSLARQMGQPTPVLESAVAVELVDLVELRARQIVREEIASLAGKALRRTQDLEFTRSPDRNLAMEVANEQMAQFWGEVLAEYGDDD